MVSRSKKGYVSVKHSNGIESAKQPGLISLTYPGIGIVRMTVYNSRKFMIVHIPSGGTIAINILSLSGAVKIMRKVGPLWDWTQGHQQLIECKQNEKIDRVLRKALEKWQLT